VYETRIADFLTRTGWMCRKKLVSAERAATLSVVGSPWRKMDPQTCSTNARTGLACPGVALIDPVSSCPVFYLTPQVSCRCPSWCQAAGANREGSGLPAGG